MSETLPEPGEIASAVPVRPTGPMPPFSVYRNFLEDDLVARLLDYAIAHKAEFEATTVGSNSVDPSVRRSTGLRDFAPLKHEIRARFLDHAPTLFTDLRVPAFEPSAVELELVAHGDGAFFKRHLDTHTGYDRDESPTHRLVSGVYYFHTQPKAFTGGQLRLHAFGPGDSAGNYLDLEPEWNTLIVFPSWAPHEVLPVHCPSTAFEDSRFAINCWLRKAARPSPTPAPAAAPVQREERRND